MKFDEIVKERAKERMDVENDKIQKEKKKIDDKKNRLWDKYSKRVIKLLDMLSIIKENDADFYSKICKCHRSDGWYHAIGFIGDYAIGYRAGGACGEIDFRFTREGIKFDTYITKSKYCDAYEHSWSADKVFDFENDFVSFENAVLTMIKKEYGEEAIA